MRFMGRRPMFIKVSGDMLGYLATRLNFVTSNPLMIDAAVLLY